MKSFGKPCWKSREAARHVLRIVALFVLRVVSEKALEISESSVFGGMV